MTEPARARAAYDDLYSIPENMIGEIIDGELIVSPRPSRRHSDATLSLGSAILPPYKLGKGGPGGWIILVEPEIAFGEDLFVPDLAGWKKERFPETEDHNWIEIVPDWVCEIVSPGTARIDRVKKTNIYGQHRVPYYWIIDPIIKTLEVLKNEAGRWLIIGTYAENDKIHDEPFQEVEINLSDLWLENTLAVAK
ncbi:MAG: Uma2 family endonuclease [Desulfobulbaceae bacterium]|nr:Uma2 family endonuclease [Desulfobulbaceae bacterium]